MKKLSIALVALSLSLCASAQSKEKEVKPVAKEQQAPAQQENDPKVTITLPISVWNFIIAAISKQPYDQASPVINAMSAQAKAQLEPVKK